MSDYKNIAAKVSERYFNYPDLLGIIWVGSSSFGITDKLSDIDIRLIVNNSDKQSPMQQFEYEGIKIEVDEMSWQWLTENMDPDSDQRWIREKGVILYDPTKKLVETFSALEARLRECTKQAIWKSYKSLFSQYEVEKCITRRDFVTADLYVHKTIENLLKFIFLYRGEPVPPFKWRWYFAKKMKLLPASLIRQINSSQLPIPPAIEKYAKQLMLKQGYSEAMVNSPWLY